ncbi:MAG: hypothetical protein ACTH54_03275 [Vagococcus salmoninarum]|uniref:hypothetical protein n=1 Tax=Vagococcus salmoninarum TaxID=2739 RepID=UPI003F9AB34F
MKIPLTVKVGGISYDVKEKAFIELDSNRNFQGACLFSETEIQILEDISEERKVNVFIHELTHAIFYEAGFEEHDEDMVNRIGNVLQQVLQDNFKSH